VYSSVCAAQSPTRLGLANDSRETGQSIGALLALMKLFSKNSNIFEHGT